MYKMYLMCYLPKNHGKEVSLEPGEGKGWWAGEDEEGRKPPTGDNIDMLPLGPWLPHPGLGD